MSSRNLGDVLAGGRELCVLAGEFWPGATAYGLADGLREQGWLVSELDVQTFIPVATSAWRRALLRPQRKLYVQEYNAALRQLLTTMNYSVLLTTKGSFITADTLDFCKQSGIFRVNYYPDVSFDHHGISEALIAQYDLVTTTKEYHLLYLRERLGPERVALVHHGYSPAVHRRRDFALAETDYDYDICYVGSASPSKLEWLKHLPDAFPDKRIAIAGAYWDRYVNGTPLASAYLGQSVTGDFYARLLERSRINVALHFSSATTDGWFDRVSTRTFEIPACGGFMLHIDNPEVRSLFDVPSEIDVFSTPDELVSKIRHYLGSPEERHAMRERAYARCVPAYSLATRAGEIIAAIRAAKAA